jgi:hypothetical protein
MNSKGLQIVTVLVVFAAALGLAACGGSDNASQSELEQVRSEAAEQARQSERIHQLQKEVKNLDHGGGGGGSSTSSGSVAPSGGSTVSGASGSCGNEVSVGPDTSCPFALNVADAYRSSGSSVVDVYSPVTGKTYTMTCTSGSPHVCTGGNNASVYFP